MITASPYLKGGQIPVCPFDDMSKFVYVYNNGTNWIGIEKTDLIASTLPAGVTGSPTAIMSQQFSGSRVVNAKAVGANFTDSIPSELHVGTVRLHDSGVGWIDIETSKGVYDATALAKLDRMISEAEAVGADIIYIIPKTPVWAAIGGNIRNIPSNMTDLTDYLQFLYNRYGTKITHYEGWNEPNVSGSFAGNIAALVSHQKTIYTKVKSMNAALKVITPSFTFVSGITATLGFNAYMTAAYSDSGSTSYYGDIIGYHFYSETTFLRYNRLAVSALKAAIPSFTGATSLPIWNTETGTSKQSRRALHEMVAWDQANGIERSIIYAWDNPGRGNMRFDSLPDPIAKFNYVADLWQGQTLTTVNTMQQPTMSSSTTAFASGAQLGAVLNGVGVYVD